MDEFKPAPLIPFWIEAIQNNVVKSISAWDFGKSKRSDTVFILGSGPSVNELAQRHFDIIRRHDSIGFNMWVAHDFVPSIYESEAPDCHGIMYDLWNQKAEKYKDVPFIVFDCMTEIIDLKRIPESFIKNMYVASTHFIEGDGKEKISYAQSLKNMREKGFFNQGDRIKSVARRRSSGVFNLSLAIQMGYKKIVLVGYDLKKHDYFHGYDKLKDVNSEYSSQVKTSGIPASVVIEAMKDEVADPMGISVSVASSSSALHPYFNVYDWR